MAVNASAVQAEWVLYEGTKDANGQLLLELTGHILLSEKLISPLGAHVHCSLGTAGIDLKTNTAKTELSGHGDAVFTGCTVLSFVKTCTVKTPGSAAGEISALGEGVGGMNGTETFLKMSSENFSTLKFEGPLCPFDGVEGTVNGSVVLRLPNGETGSGLKLATLDDEPGKLYFGEEEAQLHGASLTNPIDIHVEKQGGGAWAIKLTGL